MKNRQSYAFAIEKMTLSFLNIYKYVHLIKNLKQKNKPKNKWVYKKNIMCYTYITWMEQK